MGMNMAKKKGAQDSRHASPMGVGLVLGAGVGVALGVALDNIAVGIAVGMGVGVVFGAGMAAARTKGGDGSDE